MDIDMTFYNWTGTWGHLESFVGFRVALGVGCNCFLPPSLQCSVLGGRHVRSPGRDLLTHFHVVTWDRRPDTVTAFSQLSERPLAVGKSAQDETTPLNDRFSTMERNVFLRTTLIPHKHLALIRLILRHDFRVPRVDPVVGG